MRTFPDWVHGELRNWARWCWQGASPLPRAASHCLSVEHRYLAPKLAEGDKEERPPVIFADRAQLVDVIWKQLPALQKAVLREFYPQGRCYAQAPSPREAKRRMARQLGMKPRHFEDVLNRAGWSVEARLNNRRERG